MLTPPRYLWFGRGAWIFLKSRKKIQKLLKWHNGKHPCYASTYTFLSKNPEQVVLNKIAADIDHPTSLKLPFKAVKNFKQFCEEYGIPYRVSFSGGHGFHTYIKINPRKVNIEKTSDEYSLYRYKIMAIQHQIFERCNIGFRSQDGNLIGDDDETKLPVTVTTNVAKLKQVFRVLDTKYVNQDGEKNGHYCVAVHPEDIDKGLHRILQKAKEPQGWEPKREVNFGLDDLIDILFPGGELYIPERSVTPTSTDMEQTITTPPKLQVLEGARCLHQEIQKYKPSHDIRIEATAYLKFLGYTDNAITQFYETLGWEDYKKHKTWQQIQTIYPRLPACTKLRMCYEHLCDDCPLNTFEHGPARQKCRKSR